MRIVVAMVLAALSATQAVAGGIRGSVKLPPAPAEDVRFRPYAGRASSLAAPARTPRGLLADAVLYVQALPAGATPPSHGATPQLAQRDQAFEPRVVVVSAGGAVDFPNFDPIYHNVFSVSPARRFDLGKYPRGQSRTVTFTKPGLVNVFCDIHADMAAFILVVPNAAWTRATAEGTFELSGLPAGHYKLHWWHPDFAAGEADVDVPAAGDARFEVSF
jgi:plastocyanin